MNEMDVKAVDFGGELIESVQRGLARAPVVILSPVGRKFPRVAQGNALAPVVDALGFRPAGLRQTGVQIVENFGGDVDAKLLEFGHDLHTAGRSNRRTSCPQNPPDAVRQRMRRADLPMK